MAKKLIFDRPGMQNDIYDLMQKNALGDLPNENNDQDLDNAKNVMGIQAELNDNVILDDNNETIQDYKN